MAKQKRILIFELNWLGDILFSFPFLRALRERFPDAYIECVVVPRYADLLIHNPWINDVHVLSDNKKITSILEKLAFIRMIMREKYDTCFFLKPSRIKTVMAVLAGIPERIGFIGKNAPLTEIVETPPSHLHRADILLALAGAVGVEKADGSYEYSIGDKDEERVNSLLHEVNGGSHRIVALNPGGNWDAKRWPVENFIKLAKKMLRSFEDIEVVITGAEKDIELVDDIVSLVENSRCYAMAGKTLINELAALFKKCALVVSADSGPFHLASAIGATTIGLFGPTEHKITGPRGRGKNIVIAKDVGCRIPCYVEECKKDYACMRAIDVDEVFKCAEEQLLVARD